MRISWVDRLTNSKVLRRIGQVKKVELTLKEREIQYLGNIMRGEIYGISRLIMQGGVKGRRSVVKRRISWLKNFRKWFGFSSKYLFTVIVSKIRIANMIANLPNGDGT